MIPQTMYDPARDCFTSSSPPKPQAQSPSKNSRKRRLPGTNRDSEEEEIGNVPSRSPSPHRPLKRPNIRKERALDPLPAESSHGEPAAKKPCVGVDVVKKHYNDRREIGRSARKYSPIIKLRAFNNWIKSCLIQKFTPYTSDHPLVVLDMGCGKGGDLLKWDKARINIYVGVDVADVSVSQARNRYRDMKRVGFEASFYVLDCFRRSLRDVLPRDHPPFDIVSMQFCMHYAFESERQARTLLENVTRGLRLGGKFIGTIPNSEIIESHLKEGELKWGNQFYRVEFEKPLPNGCFRPPFGHRYSFFLQDAVEDVPEYVVPFGAFRSLAEEYNLELLYRKPFMDIFQEEKQDRELGYLLDRMGVVDQDGRRGIQGDERECAAFYLAFAFEKRGVRLQAL
ncbi:mRNA cap guanine-N7 methyltransferase [Neolecta irregularis DAH-3]|uniref:mRNA cap guanine-N(7) methyltransferase n=1 Tax=Neolecta irregularis (strain DAH-3) TaxID=1198029 RepID=A0A1U7LMV1_NEOID|nr:mRNA cap guanine-N7 methyltransferase [Neolecta irregularis DAH-3]|eukprot:OLL23872.1 mRNA cap guanine-N7 methyltransferase [Neolecta irregularis DAH-3]